MFTFFSQIISLIYCLLRLCVCVSRKMKIAINYRLPVLHTKHFQPFILRFFDKINDAVCLISDFSSPYSLHTNTRQKGYKVSVFLYVGLFRKSNWYVLIIVII
jgi:hypothetical protein